MSSISVEKLKKVRTIYCHQNCPDGIGAALICAASYYTNHFSPEIKFIQYGTKEHEHLVPDHGQMFIDITPPKNRWNEWVEYEPIVLDHHETCKEVTLKLNGIYGDENESGSTLAFKYVMSQFVNSNSVIGYKSINNWGIFAHLSMIRDTWKSNDQRWEMSLANSRGVMFYDINELINKAKSGKLNFKKIMKNGGRLVKKINDKSKLLAKSAYTFGISKNDCTLKCAIYNCTENIISETSNILIDDGCDLAISYFISFDGEDMITTVSLRSNDKIDSSKIAEKLGGGGHSKAAGFKMVNDTDVVKKIKDVINSMKF